jgi:hypothetical protein
MRDRDSNLIYETYLREWSPTNDPANNPGLAAGASLLRAQDSSEFPEGEIGRVPTGQGLPEPSEDFDNLVQTLRNGHSVSVVVDGVENPIKITEDDYDEDSGIFEGMDSDDHHVTFRSHQIDSWHRTE